MTGNMIYIPVYLIDFICEDLGEQDSQEYILQHEPPSISLDYSRSGVQRTQPQLTNNPDSNVASTHPSPTVKAGDGSSPSKSKA